MKIGDFFKDDLPKTDLYILARILHDWSDDKVHELLCKVSKTCSPGKSKNHLRYIYKIFLSSSQLSLNPNCKSAVSCIAVTNQGKPDQHIFLNRFLMCLYGYALTCTIKLSPISQRSLYCFRTISIVNCYLQIHSDLP